MAAINLSVSVRTSRVVSPYLTLVTFAIFACYAYRDVWPLMTFTLRPLDEQQGALLWVKVVLAAWTGLFVLLLEPYPYVPRHPEV